MILASTHGAGGILSLYLLSWLFKFPIDKKLFIFAVCISDIADLDFIFYGIRHTFKLDRYSHKHRKTLLHSMPLYLTAAVLIYFFGNVLYALVFLGSALSHLILDTLSSGWGIRWLWPFNDVRYKVRFFKPAIEKFSEFKLVKIVRARGDDHWLKSFLSYRNLQLWVELIMTAFFFIEFIRVVFKS